jgi:hypothetical protein
VGRTLSRILFACLHDCKLDKASCNDLLQVITLWARHGRPVACSRGFEQDQHGCWNDCVCVNDKKIRIYFFRF